MKVKEILTEKFVATTRKRVDTRLSDLEAKQAWRLAHNAEEKEFHNLVLDYYDRIRKTQNVLDARDKARKLADAQRKRAQQVRELRESS